MWTLLEDWQVGRKNKEYSFLSCITLGGVLARKSHKGYFPPMTLALQRQMDKSNRKVT